ncbi:MAG: GLPGLI family protein [Flavobacterium sp.]|nr:GLPGLI family protein [Flavobacterium sp.]
MIKVVVGSFLLLGFFVNAQEFQGKAEYFSKRIQKMQVNKAPEEQGMSPEMEKAFQEAMKSATEKQYTLSFNKSECLYEEQEKLEKPEASANGGFSISVSFSGEGKKYLNLKDKICIEEADIFGKEFLIVEPLEKPDWKLLNETKKIGDYNCFKAELIVQVTEKQKEEYKEFLKKEEAKPSLFKMEEPKDKVIIAWYTPEIPVSFGPKNYWGLPGLILEINEEESIILCSKVTLSNKEKSKIKVPNTGEKVTQKKFDEIQKKKMDSMKNDDGVIIFQQ